MSKRDVSLQSDIGKGNAIDKSTGAFARAASSYRNAISLDVNSKFPPEKGRYHLFVSLACPWAHRTLIVRKLKGLEDVIGLSVVSPKMGPDGWPFKSADDFPGTTDSGPVDGAKHVKDIYLTIEPDYVGRFTVPIVWDTKLKTIVNNESSEIIRMFNTAFDGLIPPEKASINLYPEPLRAEIDELNTWMYDAINNGVYKCGFAQSQSAYDGAIKPLFEGLDRIEGMLKDGREFLIGGQLTEADVRLYTTIVRFDPVYHGHFKCNYRTIRSGYPHINRWLKQLYWKNDAFKTTTNFDHIKTSYYWSQIQTNPTRVVPAGPVPLIEEL